MSVAGLEEGVAQTLTVNCGGGAVFYGRFFNCWVRPVHQAPHGITGISKGITQSCDVFFYTLAERLGIEKIAKWASQMGIGKKTGIDLPNEVTGIMPSEEWKMKTFHQKWYAGEVISVGIGQGAVTVSPVQLARTIGGITMGGTFYRPHVVNPDQLPSQYKEIAAKSDVVHIPIHPQDWITITDAMAGVVNPGGTAAASHLQGVDFGGKTGSAQVVSNQFRKSKSGSGNQFKDNSWFVGVSPRRNPEIVVSVLFEGGEHGKLAAHMAADVIKAYVDKQRRIRKNPTLFSDKVDPGSVPMAGIWNTPDLGEEHNHESTEGSGHLQAGTILVKIGSSKAARSKTVRAVALGAGGAD